MSTNPFESLLKALEEHGIEYCLLRDDEPSAVELFELDVLVNPAQRSLFISLLAKRSFSRWRHLAGEKEVYAALHNDSLYFLDIHYTFVQDGLKYMELNRPLSRIVKDRKGYPRLSAEDQLLHYFFHNFVGKKHLQPKHVHAVKSLSKKDLDYGYIKLMLNPALQNPFDSFLNSPEEYDHISQKTNDVYDQIISSMNNSSVQPKNRTDGILKSIFSKNRGTHFAFLGVDGAGKSTTIEAVEKRLKEIKGIKHHIVYMGPWGQTKSGFYKLAKKYKLVLPADEDLSTRNPILLIKRLTKGWLYYLLTYLELWYRYLKYIRPVLMKGQVVLSDRYVYDLRHIYKKRPVRKFKFSRYLICRMFPRPDSVIYLYNDPHAIIERKPQLNAEEISAFHQFYKKALERVPALHIKTDISTHEIASQITNKIVSNLFTKRTNSF